MRHAIFRAPTRFYKADIAFLARLNGMQSHFIMPAGFQSARDISHYANVFRLARPDLAIARMKTLLALHGVEKRVNKRPTIIDVVQAAGVSKLTVSLVLHDSPLVRDETRMGVSLACRASSKGAA